MENKDCTVESLTTSQDSLTLDLSLELNNNNGQGGILEVESPFAVACSSKSDRTEQQQPSSVKNCGNRIPRLIKQPTTKSNVPLLSKSFQTEPSTKMIKNNGNNADELLKVIQSWTDDEVMNVLKRRKSLLSHQHPAKTKQCVTQPSTKKNAFFDAQNKVSACKSLPKIQPSRRMSLMKDTKPNFDKLSNSLGAKNTMTRRIIQDSPVKKSSTVNVTYAVEDIFQSVEPTPPPSSSSSASLTGPHANSLLACLDDTLKVKCDNKEVEKQWQLQKKVNDLTIQVTQYEKKVSALKNENDSLKKRSNDLKGTDEKMKVLKKRNAELSTSAKRLEERLKQLQNEIISRNQQASSAAAADPSLQRRSSIKMKSLDVEEEKDNMIRTLQSGYQELICHLNSMNIQQALELERNGSQLENVIKLSTKERLLLERELMLEKKNRDIDGKLERCQELENEVEKLQRKLDGLKPVAIEKEKLEVMLIQQKISTEVREREFDELKQKYIETENELEKMSMEKTQLTVTNTDLSTQLSRFLDLEEENSILKESLLQAELKNSISSQTIDELRGSVDQLNAQIINYQKTEQARKQQEEVMNDLNAKLKAMESDMDSLQKKYDVQLSNAASDRQESSKQIEKYEETNQQLLESNRKLQEELEHYKRMAMKKIGRNFDDVDAAVIIGGRDGGDNDDDIDNDDDNGEERDANGDIINGTSYFSAFDNEVNSSQTKEKDLKKLANTASTESSLPQYSATSQTCSQQIITKSISTLKAAADPCATSAHLTNQRAQHSEAQQTAEPPTKSTSIQEPTLVSSGARNTSQLTTTAASVQPTATTTNDLSTVVTTSQQSLTTTAASTKPTTVTTLPLTTSASTSQQPPPTTSTTASAVPQLPSIHQFRTSLQCDDEDIYVFQALYNYDPIEYSPNEQPNEELTLTAGDYIIVYGAMDEDGFYYGESMDGNTGFVPSNFVRKLSEIERENFIRLINMDVQEGLLLPQFHHNSHIGLDESLETPPRMNADCSINSDQDRTSSEKKIRSISNVLPDPPISVHAQLDAVNKKLMVTWLPVTIATRGTSNGVEVSGYAVYIDRRKIRTVYNSTDDHVLLELDDVRQQISTSSLPCQITVRTLGVANVESNDSTPFFFTDHALFDKKLVNGAERKLNVECDNDLPHIAPTKLNFEDETVQVQLSESMRSWKNLPSKDDPDDRPAHFLQALHRSASVNDAHFTQHDQIIFNSDQLPVSQTLIKTESEIVPNFGLLRNSHHHSSVDSSPLHIKGLVDYKQRALMPSNNLLSNKNIFQNVNNLCSIDSPACDSLLMQDGDDDDDDDDINDKYADGNDSQFIYSNKHKFEKFNAFTNKENCVSQNEIPTDQNGNYTNSFSESFNDIHNSINQKHQQHQKDLLSRPQQPRHHLLHHSEIVITDNDVVTPLRIRDDIPDSELIDYEDDAGESLLENVVGEGEEDDEEDVYNNNFSVSNRDRREHHGTDDDDIDDANHLNDANEVDDNAIRIFIALFSYDPITMSPNPDASEVELKFREGQIIKIYGKKDEDGFFVGEAGGRRGLVPCNMVSEVQVDDPIVVDELLQESKRQINCSVLRANSEFSSRAPSVYDHQGSGSNGGEEDEEVEEDGNEGYGDEEVRENEHHEEADVQMAVALYDYNPHELSPNDDVEQELSFRKGDLIGIVGDVDDDGFYYGRLNDRSGLVPSNFIRPLVNQTNV